MIEPTISHALREIIARVEALQDEAQVARDEVAAETWSGVIVDLDVALSAAQSIEEDDAA